MNRIVITLRDHGRQVDLEVPGDVPLRMLLPSIYDRLGWSSAIDSWSAFAGRVLPGGKTIRLQDTLTDADVLSGHIVECQLQPAAVSAPGVVPAQATKVAFLQTEGGERFLIHGRSVLVGRPDPPQRPPDIDLTALDQRRVTSRRHAQIWLQGGTNYWVKDLHSKNGLLVDGSRLPAGGRKQLRDGVKLQFGVNGPVLIFRAPQDDAGSR